ncbi:hypothetical protein ACFVTZ_13845 [Cellulosimicrobium cellulans]|uniref:hypothetical protein n=1 Tax=Cellulosimicrobium cellulans TaxID=1710 RepID=UPI0036E6A077
MRCTAILATGAVGALLLGGTGTTTAAWRDESSLGGVVVTAGALDVALEPDGATAPVLLEPGVEAPTAYRLTTTLTGDNLEAVLRLSVPAWRDDPLLEALDVTVEVTRDAGVVATATLDPSGSLLFDGSPDVPVVPSHGTDELAVTLTVRMDAWAGNEYQGRRLPDAVLVADLWQTRPGEAIGGGRLWHDAQTAPAPAVATGTLGVEVQADEPPAGPVQAPETGPDKGTDVETGSDPDTPADTGTGTEPGGDPEAPADTGTGTGTEKEPSWAPELRVLLEDAGLDPAALDLDPLPAEIVDWAAAHDVASDDLLAWFEEVRS